MNKTKWNKTRGLAERTWVHGPVVSDSNSIRVQPRGCPGARFSPTLARQRWLFLVPAFTNQQPTRTAFGYRGSSALPFISQNIPCEEDTTLHINVVAMVKAQEDPRRWETFRKKCWVIRPVRPWAQGAPQLPEKFCFSKRPPGQCRPYAKSTDQTLPPATNPAPSFGDCP